MALATFGRIKKIIVGGVLGGVLVASLLLGGAAAHWQASTTAHSAAPIAGGCPGVATPCLIVR